MLRDRTISGPDENGLVSHPTISPPPPKGPAWLGAGAPGGSRLGPGPGPGLACGAVGSRLGSRFGARLGSGLGSGLAQATIGSEFRNVRFALSADCSSV